VPVQQRVKEQYNDEFIDLIEDYFNQPEDALQPDVHPELMYQVGATPSFTEKAREHCSRVAQYTGDDKPLTVCPPEADPKWRFFWRIGERPNSTQYENLNAPQVIPAAFPNWAEKMDQWGNLMLQACFTAAEMAAVGFDMPANSFTGMMQNGPHLLAPTASNLKKHGDLNTVFAAYHYDLNFLTIHGRSRYPGLYAWLRDGSKLKVKVPANCLLLQAGKQFEWVTGGHVLAGFHEVVVTDETLAAVERQRAANRPLWRISSTLFSHIASDQILRPIAGFANAEADAAYPPLAAGEQVVKELEAIKLGGH
jgi:isopenicillin N synthase-like dioxygenase